MGENKQQESCDFDSETEEGMEKNENEYGKRLSKKINLEQDHPSEEIRKDWKKSNIDSENH